MSLYQKFYYEESNRTEEIGANVNNFSLYENIAVVAAGPINSQENSSITIRESQLHLQAQDHNFSYKLSPSSSSTASSSNFSEAGPYNFVHQEKSASPTSSTGDESMYDFAIKTVPSKLAHRKFREPLRLRRNQKDLIYIRVPSCEERTKTVLVEMELLRQELEKKSIKEKETLAGMFPKNIRVVSVSRNVKELKLQ